MYEPKEVKPTFFFSLLIILVEIPIDKTLLFTDLIAILWIVSYTIGLIAVFFYKEQYDIINGKRLKALLK